MKKLFIVALIAVALTGCDDKENTTALQPQDQPAQMAGDQQSAPAQVSPQNGGPSDSQTVVVNGGGGGSGGGVGDFATGMLLGHMMGNAGNNGGSHTREVIRERTIVQKPPVTRSAPRKSYYGTTTPAAPKKAYSAPRSSFSSRSYSSSKSYSAPRSSYRSSFSSSYRRR